MCPHAYVDVSECVHEAGYLLASFLENGIKKFFEGMKAITGYIDE
jgi:hypothetical protein